MKKIVASVALVLWFVILWGAFYIPTALETPFMGAWWGVPYIVTVVVLLWGIPVAATYVIMEVLE